MRLIDADTAPTVEAEPVKHGHWVVNDNHHTCKCSCCEGVELTDWALEQAKYCPNCGAKMDEVEDENDGCGCKVIDEAPTVDAVEVVRCKDCQYYHIYRESDGHTEKGYGACDWINDNSVRKDHFCSLGERREER